jgi:hypothetical protein
MSNSSNVGKASMIREASRFAFFRLRNRKGEEQRGTLRVPRKKECAFSTFLKFLLI